jgi:protein SCO1/2
VTTVRDREWLTKFLLAPDKMLADNDPVAVALFNKYNKVKMPNLHMPPQDVKILIEYLQVQTAAVAQKTSAAGDSGTPGATKAESTSTTTNQGPGSN